MNRAFLRWRPASLPVSQAETFSLRRGVFQWSWCVAWVALLAAMPMLMKPYWLHIVNLALIASIGAIALNLISGTARLVSLGHAALMGVGGFTAGLLAQKPGLPFLAVIALAALLGGLVGLLVALPTLRLRMLYVAVTTLVLHFGLTLLLNVIQAGLLDSSGMVVPLATIGGYALDTPARWYYFLLPCVALCVLFAANLLRSHVGRRWAAIADHDMAAESIGISTLASKLSVFWVTSAITSATGAILGYYSGSVTYEYYSLGLAIAYLAMIIVGGLGQIKGAIMGAFVITALPYLIDGLLPRLGIEAGASGLTGLHDIAFGMLVVAFLVFEPRGLAEVWRRVRSRAADWPFRYRSAQR